MENELFPQEQPEKEENKDAGTGEKENSYRYEYQNQYQYQSQYGGSGYHPDYSQNYNNEGMDSDDPGADAPLLYWSGTLYRMGIQQKRKPAPQEFLQSSAGNHACSDSDLSCGICIIWRRFVQYHFFRTFIPVLMCMPHQKRRMVFLKNIEQ